jgi:hypothetical protein
MIRDRDWFARKEWEGFRTRKKAVGIGMTVDYAGEFLTEPGYPI